MSRLFSMAISTQLRLMLLVVAVPVVALLLYSGLRVREEVVHEGIAQTQVIAAELAEEQRHREMAARQLLLVLAQLPEVVSHTPGLGKVFGDIHRVDEEYASLFAADATGHVFASYPAAAPFSVADRLYFKRALSSGRIASGEYVVGRASGQPSLHFAYPFRDERGEIAGVVGVGFSIDKQHVPPESALPPGTNLTLLDQRGTVAWRPYDSRGLVGNAYDAGRFEVMRRGPALDSFIGTGISGEERIITYRKLFLEGEDEPYLYVRASMPVRTLRNRADLALAAQLAIFFTILGAALWMASLIGRRSITRRIEVLESAASRVASGDLSVRVSAQVAGGELGQLGVSFDAMAAQLARREKELVQSERNYREIFDASGEAIFVHDEQTGRIVEANLAALQLTGLTREQLRGETAGERGPQALEELGWFRPPLAEPGQTFLWEGRRKDGARCRCEVTLTRTHLGEQAQVLAVVRDVTERERAQEQVRTLAALVENSSEFIGISDFTHRVTYLNPAARRMVGLPGTGLERLHPADFFAPDQAAVAPAIKEALDQKGRWSGEVNYRNLATGELIPVEMSALVITRPDSGAPLANAVICRDIRERRAALDEKQRLREQLMQAQKMESIGRLAGGVAHDFNNMLSVILGEAELLHGELGSRPPLLESVEEIEKAARRSRDVIRQLLAFSRKQLITPMPLDLNQLLAVTEKTLARLIGEQVELRCAKAPGLWTVRLDPSQVDQILVNLVINARDAMPEGGAVTLSTANVELDEAACRERGGLAPGPYVVLRVADSGVGMAGEVLDKIFEPFFTTKEPGKGTGLGLATVYGIVTQNRGAIDVQSEPGKGTTFSIYFPRAQTDAVADAAAAANPTPPGGQGTVLLVEDDPMVQKTTRRMLASLGYQVLLAPTAQDAESLASQGKVIDLLLTDVVMPGVNGPELRNRLVKIRPNLKVLFMSGYAADAMPADSTLDPGTPFLHKPFTMRDLAEKVRQALG